MKIENTSRYSNAEVRYLVNFAAKCVGRKQIGRVRGVEVRNRNNGRTFSGHAWGSGYVVVSVGAPECFPKTIDRRRSKERYSAWPVFTMQDWRECIVAVSAHEFGHLEQFQRSRRLMKHIPVSEIECEQEAKRAVEAFRKDIETHNQKMAELIEKDKGKVANKQMKRAAAKSASGKLAKLEDNKKRWMRKLKLAQTKLKMINRKMKYYQKKESESASVVATV